MAEEGQGELEELEELGEPLLPTVLMPLLRLLQQRCQGLSILPLPLP